MNNPTKSSVSSNHAAWLVILNELGMFGRGKKALFANLDERFGAENWAHAWYADGAVKGRTAALQLFEDAYCHFLRDRPDILEWLVKTASEVYCNSPSNIESRLDYNRQEYDITHLHDIAVRRALIRLDRTFQGDHPVEIRWQDSEGYVLNPGQVPFHQRDLILPRSIKQGWWKPESVEAFYQHNKTLLVNPDAFIVSHLITNGDRLYVRNKRCYYLVDQSDPKKLWKQERDEMHQRGVFENSQHYKMARVQPKRRYSHLLNPEDALCKETDYSIPKGFPFSSVICQRVKEVNT